MLRKTRRAICAFWPLWLVLALSASVPSCAGKGPPRERNPAADDLDAARSDFDRHTPPGGD